jgi:hypothetical protein
VAKLTEKQLSGKSRRKAPGNMFATVFHKRLKSMNGIKDYLEELMDLKKIAAIRFRPVEGGVTEINGRIVKMDEVSGRLIVETDAGYTIGDDQILQINGRSFENIC